METGGKVWVLRNITLCDGRGSTGPAWIHIPTGVAYVVKTMEFGKTLAHKIDYVHHGLPMIATGDWDYAE